MILNCSAAFVQLRPSSHARTVCLASPEQLRQQLDNLHKEADNTRAKANNARLRLMRLSEAAEKFRRQAAVNVQAGNENDARKLLFQKKKVMQAMEKLKSRIELFDELYTKLNEAISMKEGLLIGNIALDIEVNEPEAHSPIRIVSPKEANPYNSNENPHTESDLLKSGEDQELQVVADSVSQRDLYAENEWINNESSFSPKSWNDLNNVQHLKEISSYEDFMKHVDQQLNKIEEELETFLSVSTLLLESKKKPENLKVQHVRDILEGIHHTRERIAIIIQLRMSSNEVPF